MGKTVNKDISKNFSGKYNQKHFDLAKKFAADPLNTASKRKILKTEEAEGDLIRNKISNKITNNLFQNNSQIEESIEIPQERSLSPEKRQLKMIT